MVCVCHTVIQVRQVVAGVMGWITSTPLSPLKTIPDIACEKYCGHERKQTTVHEVLYAKRNSYIFIKKPKFKTFFFHDDGLHGGDWRSEVGRLSTLEIVKLSHYLSFTTKHTANTFLPSSFIIWLFTFRSKMVHARLTLDVQLSYWCDLHLADVWR